MTVPTMPFGDFLKLARGLDCMGVEARNDLDRPLFDGMDAADAGQMIRDHGLRLVGLSQVYPFNSWSDEIEAETRALIDMARACGAETISLIPRNDGTQTGNGERHANLRIALKAIRPMLEDAGLVALVEPLGFPRSSLRSKQELVETIEALDAGAVFRIVHDTFHHALAGGGPIFPAETGIVHVSGVADPSLPTERMEDADRGLVDERDRLGNVAQFRALLEAGYDGPVSFECFSPEVHRLSDPETALRASFDFISSHVSAKAA
ncbi:TIM barrel protein [Primorskyibacter aestuariivivens]|uniref:TIM barrel protein n=1 Tax=Primorskyibacter aestuariivivens TaxID=1888912 RepID=UPI002300E11D|nr:TIM barrel protein [Primorskyibacter aestuariivivens]MDA7428992.1 TIM barrel protein [Primorskyibacter aestuariivivens]